MAAALISSLVLAAIILSVEAYPPYIRGNGTYQWVLSRKQRDNGVYYLGSNSRLRRAMHKMLAGEPVHITMLGGSNTAGDIRWDGLAWPQYVFNYMSDRYGAHVTGNNGAVGGTKSNYMGVCHNMAVPRAADVVVLEYAINDGHAQGMSPDTKRVQERLIRKLLNYPHKPAVILAHLIPWNHPEPEKRYENWWGGAEAAYNELALYYHVPTVSVRGCCFQQLFHEEPGFNTTVRTHLIRDELKEKAFYVDPGHIDGLTGARVLAELVVHAMERAVESFQILPYNEDEEGARSPDTVLPQPLFPNNYESSADRCFIGPAFQNSVSETSGFEWINEAKGSRPRWGYVSKQPGSWIRLKFSSNAVDSSNRAARVAVLLAHLKSYRHMGTANVTCVSGCECEPTLLDGSTEQKHSQQELHIFQVTQSPECVVQITVTDRTLSGEHKVKLTGLVISEEDGDAPLSGHHGAMENVGTNAARSHSGVFDVAVRDRGDLRRQLRRMLQRL